MQQATEQLRVRTVSARSGAAATANAAGTDAERGGDRARAAGRAGAEATEGASAMGDDKAMVTEAAKLPAGGRHGASKAPPTGAEADFAEQSPRPPRGS